MQPVDAFNFIESIKSMNQMYKLPVQDYPALLDSPAHYKSRIKKFHATIADEVNELLEIIEKKDQTEFEVLTDMADLLGDIVVYCFSEAAKYGIPLGQVLQIIMESNKSKLGKDGQPIYDDNGKFLKGPYYWKPEPVIMKFLQSHKETVQQSNMQEVEESDSLTDKHDNPVEETVEFRLANEAPKLDDANDIFEKGSVIIHKEYYWNQFIRSILNSTQIEKLAMDCCFAAAAHYRAVGANGIARAYDSLFREYSGRGDKLEDLSVYYMWHDAGWPLREDEIIRKLQDMKYVIGEKNE